MWPRKQLASEAGTQKARDDPKIFCGDAKHLRQHLMVVYNALGGFIKRERLAIPNRHACMQLDRIVGFNGSPVGFIERDSGAGESLVRGAAGAIDARLPIRIEMRSDVWLLLAVGDFDSGRSCVRLLEGLGNYDGDILAVVANDIIFEIRAGLTQIV